MSALESTQTKIKILQQRLREEKLRSIGAESQRDELLAALKHIAFVRTNTVRADNAAESWLELAELFARRAIAKIEGGE